MDNPYQRISHLGLQDDVLHDIVTSCPASPEVQWSSLPLELIDALFGQTVCGKNKQTDICFLVS